MVRTGNQLQPSGRLGSIHSDELHNASGSFPPAVISLYMHASPCSFIRQRMLRLAKGPLDLVAVTRSGGSGSGFIRYPGYPGYLGVHEMPEI